MPQAASAKLIREETDLDYLEAKDKQRSLKMDEVFTKCRQCDSWHIAPQDVQMLVARVKALEADNSKLRSYLLPENHGEVCQFMAENTKLRRVVEAAKKKAKRMHPCDALVVALRELDGETKLSRDGES